MAPKRRAVGRRANTRRNQVGDAPAVGQDQPPVGGIPAEAQVAAIAANRAEMQELHNMMREIFDRPMYAPPPPPAPGVAAPGVAAPGVAAPGVAAPQHHQPPPPGVAAPHKRTWDNRDAGPSHNRYPKCTRRPRA
ncbi:unnamed protein product [Arabidopsis arenosa]|uniref:Uncharacterized protein n=1 Tax=Arabidopsis arenosa TaxID=38785 RepID=A0A8S1ZIE7_ARAAE|nr:unnamed protein product [Arabidopsis arenosa]